MTDAADDFIKHYQQLAQQAWGGWLQPWTAELGSSPFFRMPSMTASDDPLSNGLGGLKDYFDWLKQAAEVGLDMAGSAAIPDWRAQLQQLVGQLGQSTTPTFMGLGPNATNPFAESWQAWIKTMQQSAQHDLAGAAPLGFSRESQLQQRELAEAIQAYLEVVGRYQALLQRSQSKAYERLQEKLAEQETLNRHVDSLKALYDLWIDAAEESYAEIALSAEFRLVYGEMVNAQMRVRELQQKRVEQMCRECGMPTRSEVASMGQRIQEIRRELRAQQARHEHERSEEIASLRNEVTALKRQAAEYRNSVKSHAPRKAAAAADKPLASRRRAAARVVTTTKTTTAARKPK